MRCTIPAIADANVNVTEWSFRAFRDVRTAVRFATKTRGSHLRVCHYSMDERDVRYVVNYVGRAKREHVKLSPKRVIMTQGIVTDRYLPTLVS